MRQELVRFVLLFVLAPVMVASSAAAFQRMGLLPGVSRSIAPGSSAELPARCMDEDARPPTSRSRFTRVLNSNTPQAVVVEVEGETRSLQSALDDGLISISGVTTPAPGIFRARIDALRVRNLGSRPIRIRVRDGAILGGSGHSPFQYAATELLTRSADQESIWREQVSRQRRWETERGGRQEPVAPSRQVVPRRSEPEPIESPGAPGLCRSEAPPRIEFSVVPPIGSFANVRGRVGFLATPCDPSAFRVALYIHVSGVKPRYFCKPNAPAPLSLVGANGDWEIDYTTGGNDEQAGELIAFLVTADSSWPCITQDLPEVDGETVLARVATTR